MEYGGTAPPSPMPRDMNASHSNNRQRPRPTGGSGQHLDAISASINAKTDPDNASILSSLCRSFGSAVKTMVLGTSKGGWGEEFCGQSSTYYQVGGRQAIALVLSVWALFRKSATAGAAALWAVALALAAREWTGSEPVTVRSASRRVPLVHDPSVLLREMSAGGRGADGYGRESGECGDGGVGTGECLGEDVFSHVVVVVRLCHRGVVALGIVGKVVMLEVGVFFVQNILTVLMASSGHLSYEHHFRLKNDCTIV